MKKILFLILIFAPILGEAQAIDSSTIREVDSLIQLSRSFAAKRNFNQALEVNATAEKIAREKSGLESAIYGTCCYNHGRILNSMNDYASAEKWLVEAKAIRKKVLGTDHPDYNWALNSLASTYKRMGQFEKSESLYLEAKTNLSKVLGVLHPGYAEIVNNLAILYHAFGLYEKAEPLYLEALNIFNKVRGKDHPDYAWSLNGLAGLYFLMGQYAKAESMWLETSAINEKHLGKDHPEYAGSLINLANLYLTIGQNQRALELYVQAKSIRERTLGKDNREYAESLGNLAFVYANMGQYDKAENLFLESMTIDEKVWGKTHYQYGIDLYNLAGIYFDMGKFDKAEVLWNESKEIIEKILGREHPYYAGIVENCSIIQSIKGNYVKAEELFLESKSIIENLLGKENLDYATNLKNLVLLYQKTGQSEKAIFYSKELSLLNQNLILNAIHHLSEKELKDYLELFSQSQDFIFTSAYQAGDENLFMTCFDNTLFYKGFILYASSKIKRLALNNSETQAIYNELKSYRRLLSREYAAPVASRDSSHIARLEHRANEIEKELVNKVSEYGNTVKQLSWNEVRDHLKPGEAAMEFVRFKISGVYKKDSTMYCAMVLKYDVKSPIFVPLFEEKSLDSLLPFSRERKRDYVNQLYTLPDRGAELLEQAQRSLYDLIWRPVEKELAGVKTVYYSPAGLLHRLNIGAIPIDAETTVADRYNCISLNSTRQLVIPTSGVRTGKDAVLYGGLEYESDSMNLSNEHAFANRSRGELSFGMVDSTLRGGNWNYLVGTDKEVKAIGTILNNIGIQTQIRTGLVGTEESFKLMGEGKNSPRIVHIATHGYFFPDVKKEEGGQQLAVGSKEPVYKMSEHPMLRSGLILSRGNAGWKGERTLVEREDGVLTAYEISQMDLSNTELVVLSACETGLGDIQGNEGVYGLQRAFKIAGVKYIIMSLWKVPDIQTSMLMTAFYKKWLEAEGPDKGGNKMSIPDAFHAAQKELRDMGFDPYQWAGFVLIE